MNFDLDAAFARLTCEFEDQLAKSKKQYLAGLDEIAALKTENTRLTALIEKVEETLGRERRWKQQYFGDVMKVTHKSERTIASLQEKIGRLREALEAIEKICAEVAMVESATEQPWIDAWKKERETSEKLRQLAREISEAAHMRDHATNADYGIFVVPVIITIRQEDFEFVVRESQWKWWQEQEQKKFRQWYIEATEAVIEGEEDCCLGESKNEGRIKEYKPESEECKEEVGETQAEDWNELEKKFNESEKRLEKQYARAKEDLEQYQKRQVEYDEEVKKIQEECFGQRAGEPEEKHLERASPLGAKQIAPEQKVIGRKWSWIGSEDTTEASGVTGTEHKGQGSIDGLKKFARRVQDDYNGYR